jgi:hypothetical protein
MAATRRKTLPRTSRSATGRSSSKTFAPPVRSFRSDGGRTFTVERGLHWERYAGDPLWSDTFHILFRDDHAGKLFRSLSYGTTRAGKPRWHASISELRGRNLSDLPRGIGFDVGPFDTVEETLAAWGQSADQILDFQASRQSRTVHERPQAVAPPIPTGVLSAGVAAAITGGLSQLLRGMGNAAGGLGEHFGVRDARRAMEHWFANEEVHTAVQQSARAYLMSPHGRKLLTRVTDSVAGAIRKAAGKVGYKDVGAAIIEALQ